MILVEKYMFFLGLLECWKNEFELFCFIALHCQERQFCLVILMRFKNDSLIPRFSDTLD